MSIKNSYDVDSICEIAKDAGSYAGKAKDRLHDVIKAIAASGIKDYAHDTTKAARKAYADACQKHGTSRNNGMTQFANAWDALAADLGLDERTQKGQSRHATAPTATPADAGDGSKAEPEKPKLSEKELKALRERAAFDAFRRAGLDTLAMALADDAKEFGELEKAALGNKNRDVANAHKAARVAFVEQARKLLTACQAVGVLDKDRKPVATYDDLVAARDAAKTAKGATKAAADAKAAKGSKPASSAASDAASAGATA